MTHALARLCGTAPDAREDREHDLRTRRWRMVGHTLTGPNLGPVSRWRRRQYSYPACGGNAGSALWEVIHPEDGRISAIDLWRGARRRLGLSLDDLSQGTTYGAILQELELRGADDWHEGEDRSALEGGKGSAPAGDNLRDELRAYDRRERLDRHRCSTLREVEDAVATGAGVGISTGLRDPFFELRVGDIATERHIGGDANGHAMRVVGFVTVGGQRLAVLDNWWGDSWGGCSVEGLSLPGHCLVTAQALLGAWDIWAITRRER